MKRPSHALCQISAHRGLTLGARALFLHAPERSRFYQFPSRRVSDRDLEEAENTLPRPEDGDLLADLLMLEPEAGLS
jgi:hypothetical protein